MRFEESIAAVGRIRQHDRNFFAEGTQRVKKHTLGSQAISIGTQMPGEEDPLAAVDELDGFLHDM